jgi:hypothetical protein
MDASDLIRKKLQTTVATAAVSASTQTTPVTTQNNITTLKTISFASQDDKMNFDAGMKYVYYDAAGVPNVSTMNFCAQRLPKQE